MDGGKIELSALLSSPGVCGEDVTKQKSDIALHQIILRKLCSVNRSVAQLLSLPTFSLE